MKRLYPIVYGDRIFLRAIQDGAKVLEVTVCNVSDLTGLVGEIRYAGRQIDGLTRLFVRNMTQGWSIERPFRFYSDVPSPARQATKAAVLAAGAAYRRRLTPSGRYVAPSKVRRHTTFPWETH